MKQENILNNRTNSLSTVSLVQMALMIAITCVSTMVIKVPTLFGVGYDHLGDSMVFLGAILFGRKKGAITAAVGMSLADFLLGYAYYVPFTFIIKAIMAYIAASVAYRGTYKGKNMLNNLFGFIAGGAWMVFGYFLAKIVIVEYIVVKASSFNQALAIALAGIQSNIGQVTLGMIIAIPLAKALQSKVKIEK
ncbi:ECF transporter S component [Clostridium sp. JS66]|uniref:ECF transporter S component n=1 Tax=Clostridium sp. JS66 TaxID=3064705 RepID=UPI00298D8B6A|nr:ECF transporter S component [Clostridium sp. JS66]WPC44049.1 ECF transporter S component [Clostridium sp. JS66]